MLILLLLCNGCGVWLRYRYEDALTHLPKTARVISLNNSYILAQNVVNAKYQYVEYIYPIPKIIEYSVVETNTYKFYYGDEGQIYRVDKVERTKK